MTHFKYIVLIFRSIFLSLNHKMLEQNLFWYICIKICWFFFVHLFARSFGVYYHHKNRLVFWWKKRCEFENHRIKHSIWCIKFTDNWYHQPNHIDHIYVYTLDSHFRNKTYEFCSELNIIPLSLCCLFDEILYILK